MNTKKMSPKPRIYRLATHDTIIIMQQLIQKLFKWGIVGTFFLIPLVYISTWVSPYTTPKLFFFMGFVDILVIVWAWLMILDNRFRPTKNIVLWFIPVTALLGFLTASSFLGIDPATSFLSTVESGTGLIMLYHALVFSLMVACAVRVFGVDLFRKISKSVFFSSLILVILTFFTDSIINIHSDMLNHSSRGAMMGNVLFLGSLLTFTFFLGIILLITESKKTKKIWYGLGLFLILFSPTFFLPGHFSDGARMAGISLIVGLVGAGLVWLVLYQKQALKILGIVGIIISLVAGSFVVYQVSIQTSHLGQIFVHESGNRLSDWHEAILGIKEKPLFGSGMENYRLVVQKYLDPHVFDPGKGNEVWTLHPHNSSLEILVNGGIVGFIAYVAMILGIFSAIVLLYRRKIITTSTCALLIGMMIAYLLQDQMVFDTVTSYMMLFGVLGIVIGLVNQTLESAYVPPTLSPQDWTSGISASSVMIFVLVLCVLIPSYKISEMYELGNDTSDYRATAYSEVFTGIGSQMIQNQVSGYVDALVASYTSQEKVLFADQNLRVIAAHEIDALGNTMEKVWQKRPFDYHLTLSLAQLQNLSFIYNGQVDPSGLARAEKYEKQGMMLSPTDPQIYAVYAQTLAFSGDTKNALIMVQKSLDLNQNYGFAEYLRSLLVGKNP